MGRRGCGIVLAVAAVAGATPTGAQTELGTTIDEGLHWSVAAPLDASWALDCRFAPITYKASNYDLHHWANRIRQTGHGTARGRLPTQEARCILTKTAGAGPVGLALVKNGVATADGTRDIADPARVTVI